MKALGSLDLFLLAMLERGLVTPYDLRVQAGLSVGATTPALRRLKRAGLITSARSPKRLEFALTPEGRRQLRQGWRPALRSQLPSEVEGILRLAVLALLQSGKPRIAADYLRRAADAQEELAGSTPSQPLPGKAPGPGAVLQAMKAAVDGQRHLAQARVLRRLARQVQRLPVTR